MTAPAGATPPAFRSSRAVCRKSGSVGYAHRGPLIVSVRCVSRHSGSRTRSEQKMRSGGGKQALVWNASPADTPLPSTAPIPDASVAPRSMSSLQAKTNTSPSMSLGCTVISPFSRTSYPTRKRGKTFVVRQSTGAVSRHYHTLLSLQNPLIVLP